MGGGPSLNHSWWGFRSALSCSTSSSESYLWVSSRFSSVCRGRSTSRPLFSCVWYCSQCPSHFFFNVFWFTLILKKLKRIVTGAPSKKRPTQGADSTTPNASSQPEAKKDK